MKILQRTFNEKQLNIIKNLAKDCSITELTAKILYGRGYTSVSSINGFLYPNKSQFNDPYGLVNMDKAVERITCARDNAETVVVYGDYDADGVCSTAVLYKSLRNFGIEAITVVPERENGYGLSVPVIDEILDNYFPDLIITVDCGISNHEEIEYLKDLGVDVIVTDHHEIPEILPECLIINCKLKNQEYGFDSLCGAGVAYKLAYALIGEKANEYLDLVALATVADSMPLISENRSIVKEGLEIIKSGNSCKAIKTLINLVGLKEITSSSLAYGITPRINAGGRMGDAYSSLKLLLSDNFKEIDELCNKLIKYNIERQQECEKLYSEAKDKLKVGGNYDNAIVLYDDNWKTGLVGIVAAKLAEEYNVPTILFTRSGELYHGSARSIDGINIYEVIKECESLLSGFGGHSQAAGVTVEEDNITAFANKLSEVIKSKIDLDAFDKSVEVDGEINGELSRKFLKELSLFEPCGISNKKPIFVKTVDKIDANIIKNLHLSFVDSGLDYMYFNGINNYETLALNAKKSLIVEPTISTYNGKEYIKGYVKFIASVEFNPNGLYNKAFINQIQNLATLGIENFTTISSSETQEMLNNISKIGYGTLFVLNNPKNSYLIENSSLNKFILELNDKTGKNAILIGGLKKSTNLSAYKKIVHIDKPQNIIDTGVTTIVNGEVNAFDFSELNTDRLALVSVYKELVQIVNRGAKNLIDAYEKSTKSVSFKEFAFSGEVFKELGFIIEKDMLYIDKTVKRDLTESKIYNKIVNVKL